MARTASRSEAYRLTVGVGMAGSVLALIWLVVDYATSHTVAAHVEALYSPYGAVPDTSIPWFVLLATFGLASASWALILRGTLTQASWVRIVSIAAFVLGTALLVFLFLVQEHGTPILPTGWRVVSLVMAGYGAVAMLVAFLPTTEKIKA